METTFPNRYFLLIVLLYIGSIITGCGSEKKYSIDPKPVYNKVFNVDSSYTTVDYIKTGNGSRLFCGPKESFNTYSFLAFDSVPSQYDSIFLKLKSDSTSTQLEFFTMLSPWYEDSIYEWDDLGILIDTSLIIQMSNVDGANPLLRLTDSVVSSIGNYGIAVYADPFYYFNSREEDEPRLKVYTVDTLGNDTTYNISCIKDLYMIKNPFDTLFSDSLIVGRGLSIKTHSYIPVDSLPLEKKNISRGGLVYELDEVISMSLIAKDTAGNTYLSEMYSEGDTNFVEFKLNELFNGYDGEGLIHVIITSQNKLENIETERIFDGKIKLMWADFE